MRAFIAIELPEEIRVALSQLQEQLKKAGADVKWVKPQNIHLTLKFLGEIDAASSSKISRILQDITRDKNSFQLRISSIGAFPKINSPRVLWLGIDKGDSESKKIVKELEENIAKIGIPQENRPFSSHITIGRTRSASNRDKLVQNLENLAGNFGKLKENLEFSVKKITFFKSTLTPSGPIYEVLKEALFQ
jgi:2'-5' RNA ligase